MAIQVRAKPRVYANCGHRTAISKIILGDVKFFNYCYY